MTSKHRKKTRRRYNEATAKIQIDRFFQVCREKLGIYAFQNESMAKLKFLKGQSLAYIVTTKPKREFFLEKDNNKLKDDGFVIEYNNFTKEIYDKVKAEMFAHFRNSFFIKLPKEDLRNKNKETFGGKIIIKNLRFNDEEENLWQQL